MVQDETKVAFRISADRQTIGLGPNGQGQD